MKLKEEKYKLESFIGGWYIPESICNDFIKFYNKNNFLHTEGKVTKGIDKEVKESTDLYLNANDSFLWEYNKYLNMCLKNYVEKYKELDYINKFSTIPEQYNIQYYKPKQGFKTFHCERTGKINSLRMLVFMTYLNDVSDGGTEFKYQKLTTKAKKGLTLIWPPDFTHTHKGQISNTNEKYIITGWFSFI
jgi:hypothetical protein